MVAGAITLALTDIQRGEDPSKRWREPNGPEEVLQDRGRPVRPRCLMGHLSPYADAAIKMFGLSGATRYHRNDALQSILGVNAGFIGYVSRFRSAMTSGDTKAVMRRTSPSPVLGAAPHGASPLLRTTTTTISGGGATGPSPKLVQRAGMVTIAPGATSVLARAKRIWRTVKASLLSKSSSAIQNQV